MTKNPYLNALVAVLYIMIIVSGFADDPDGGARP